MKSINRINSVLFQIEKWISMIGFVGMVSIVLYSILRREILQQPFSAGEEITRNLTVVVIFISAAMAVNCRSHVGVEAIVNLIPQRFQKQIWIFRSMLELILWFIIFVLSSLVMIHYIQSGQVTPISRYPVWMTYACVPACCMLSIFHMATRIINEKERWRG